MKLLLLQIFQFNVTLDLPCRILLLIMVNDTSLVKM